ncbi:MAG: flippase-like domain-containing protein [Henriciella sp.]|nr:flippase-like domain-containing protein [Henriciella sp.]
MTTDASPQSKQARPYLATGLKLLVTVIILAVIFHFVSVEEIWAGITRTNPLVWGGVLIGFLIGHVLASFKWGLLVGQKLPFPDIVKAHFAGLAANIALPGVAGGDVARAAILSRKVMSRSKLVTGSILDRLIDVGGLVLIAALGAAMLGTAGQTGLWLQGISAAIIVVALIAFLLLPMLARIVQAQMAERGKAGVMIAELAHYMAEHRIRILICASLSILIQTGFVLLNVALAWSMQGPTNIAIWLFAWPLAKLIATLPISLGGLGVREASLAAIFAGFAFESPVVIAVGFVWQTILISTGLIGLAVQAWSGKFKAAPESAQ